MKALRHSRQREAVLKFLRSTKSHPTAEAVYGRIKAEIPEISLGTVYRNLSLLEELGEIIRIPGEGGEPDRFDADTSNHQHLLCSVCGRVLDLEIDDGSLDRLAADKYGCTISGHRLLFFGICPECTAKA